MASVIYINFPDYLASWPWPRALNPRYEEAKAASGKWVASYGCFSPKAQQAFDACDFNLLAALSYPTAEEDILRLGCDLMNIFFLFDEFTDCGDKEEVRKITDMTMDALRNPHQPRPEGEIALGEVCRDFAERVSTRVPNQARERFIECFDRYTAAVIEEAQDRTNSRIRPIREYIALRRETVGAEPSFSVVEFGLDLPNEVFEHPVMQKVLACAVDMLIITNDMYSFNVEQARGDPHNLITSIMHDLSVDIDGAYNWAASYYNELATTFLSIYNGGLPSFTPEIDAQVVRYVEGLAHWARGIDAWSFETQRYFGARGEAVRLTRRIELLPRHERVAVDGVVSGLDIMEKHTGPVEVAAAA